MKPSPAYNVFMRLTELAVAEPKVLRQDSMIGADAAVVEMLQELQEISIMADALGARLDRLMQRKLMALSETSGIAPVQ